ncbi:MAG: hypothetical protein ACI4OP_00405 [Candidatus Coprovivens sp.]
MKNKLFKFILTICLILVFPMLVNADMGAPESYEYDVIITNPNGATATTWEGGKEVEVIIPYNEVVTVTFEHQYEGKLTLSVNYNDNYLELNAEDVMVYSNEIDFSKMEKNKDGDRYLLLENVEMYKGPSIVYGKIENTLIPKDTYLDFQYSFDPMEGIGRMWIYTEYNGIKGWVYVYGLAGYSPYESKNTIPAVVVMKKPKTTFLAADVNLYTNLNDLYEENRAITGTIKGGQFISYTTYIYPGPKCTAMYVTVDGISGWLFTYFNNGPGETITADEYEGELLVIKKDGLKVYENYNDTTPVSGVTIPYLTKLDFNYEIITSAENYNNLDMKYHITYQGKKYWIFGKETDFAEIYSWNAENTVNAKSKISMYKYNNKSEKLDITIAKGSKLSYISEEYSIEDIPNITNESSIERSFVLVEYDGVIGWVSKEDVTYEFVPVDPDKPEEPTEEPDKPEEEKGGKSMTPLETALICIGGAVILSITTVVVIVLFNKKKKDDEPSIVQVNEPSDATIEHRELIRLLDEALKKEHIDSDATIEHKELVRLLDEALKEEHVDSAATMEHKELVKLLDQALEKEHIDSDATIEHKELVRLLDQALEKEHIDSDATIEHKELVRLLDQALEKEHIDSDATIEHKELVRLLDEALKEEHVDSAATMEHKELVRLLDEALELDKHIDSDATIEHKELVRLLDEALKKEEKPEAPKKPAAKKNKKKKKNKK